MRLPGLHQASTESPVTEDRVEDATLPLHSWRRLDWRFLQPTLEPRSVGYGGAVDAALLTALRLLDRNAAPVTQAPTQQRYDVVLLAQPDLEDLKAAASAVRPGGWLCAEIRRAGARRGGPRTLLGWRRAFRRAGFEEVRLHWHAPTLDLSARIVPLDEPAAVRSTLHRHQGIRFGKAKSLVGQLALILGLFPAAVPEGTVVGRQSAVGHAR